MTDIPLKFCTKCQITKPLSEFHVDRKARDGHSYHCKECIRAQVTAHSRAKGTKPMNRHEYAPLPEGYTKTCIGCGEVLPANRFYKNYKNKDGLVGACKSCSQKREKQRKVTYLPKPRMVWKQEQEALMKEGKRKCSVCMQVHPLDNFYVMRRSTGEKPDGRCKDCWRKRAKSNPNSIFNRQRQKIKTRFNMTIEEYNVMLAQQDGVCAICGEEEVMFDYRINAMRRLSIDHCHKTGKIRGLLCNACNAALGFLQEDPRRIQAMLLYIEKHKTS